MKEVTIEEFKYLQSQGKKILVDLNAVWCMPCRELKPRLNEMSLKYPDVVFLSIDVDKNRDGAVEMGVRSLPTVMIFNGNTLINRSSGAKLNDYYHEILTEL